MHTATENLLERRNRIKLIRWERAQILKKRQIEKDRREKEKDEQWTYYLRTGAEKHIALTKKYEAQNQGLFTHRNDI